MNKVYSTLALLLFLSHQAFAQLPIIQSFAPQTGTVGSLVIIKGNYFSSIASNNTVYFGTVKATVSAATDTSITVSVPAGSFYAPISVKVDSLSVNSQLPFITTSGNGALLLSNSFGDPVYVAAAQAPCLGDFDGDGFIDIAGIITGNKISIFRNADSAGKRVYQAVASYACATNPSIVITADFNGDGKLDVVVSGGGVISIFRNRSIPGNLLFDEQVRFSFTSSGNIFSMATGEIDGDGQPDIVVGYESGSTCFTVARNVSIGDSIIFGPRTSFAFGSVPGGAGTVGNGSEIFLADVDGDGKLDVSGVSRFFPPFLIYRNTSVPDTVRFAPKVAITSNKNFSTGNGTYDLKLADIDGDSKPEILYVANDSMLFSFYTNNSSPGNISFGPKSSLPVNGWALRIAVNDLNGDGMADVAVLASTGVYLFQNNSQPGAVGFKAPRVLPGSFDISVELADMDADTKADIVVSDFYFGNVFPNKTYIFKSNFGESAAVKLCSQATSSIIECDLEGSTYQWQVDTGNGFENIIADTMYSGINTGVLQISHLRSSWSGYQYRCLVDNNYSTVQVLKFVAVFNGGFSSAWENINNWDCRQLPDANTDVIINAKNAILNSNVQVRSVQVIAQGSLTVRQPYRLQIVE